MDDRNRYQTDLSEAEWAQVRRAIPAPKPGGRPAKYDRREIVKLETKGSGTDLDFP